MKHSKSRAFKKSPTWHRPSMAVFLGAALLGTTAFGGTGTTPSRYAAFTRSTDTISATGNTAFTNKATYEVIFSPTSTSGGGIWNTWQALTQDDGIAENNGNAEAYTYPASPSFFIVGGLSVGNWYDVAYVYDGSQERMYINGVLAASRAASGNAGVGMSNTMNVGALYRDNTIASSFLGDIVSLRISDTARYSGNSYSSSMSDFSNDSSTELLYNFDQLAPGSTTITDASGNGHTGTFGAGFAGATSPTIVVPEPGTASLLVAGLLWLFGGRRRKQPCPI